MATQKPISTISYNSEAFLKEKLQDWLDAHLIQAYQYICHKGEDGDKDHIHLRIEPNKTLDPMNLTEDLKEYVKGNDKPLCVRPWRPSKEEDWFLYAVHNKEYLERKYNGGEKGEKLPYSIDNVVVNDEYDKYIAYQRAVSYMEHTTANLAKRYLSGENGIDLILSGENAFVVNSVIRAVAPTAFDSLQREYDAYKARMRKLIDGLHDKGIEVYWSSDDWVIEYIDNPFDDETRTQNESAGAQVPHGEESL